MNLHGAVRGVISAINPDIAVTHLRNTSYTTSASGKQVPVYSAVPGVRAQVQACTDKDIQRMASMSIQGVLRTVYMYGSTIGIVRGDGKGGDILKFPQVPGATVEDWKVVSVKETWPDWSCVIVQLQSTIIVLP